MSEAPPQSLPLHDDELTQYERGWIERLAKVMAEGFGSAPSRSGRGKHLTTVRSGVYRGAISALVPIYDEIADTPEDGELFDIGNDAAKQALWDMRVCPNQT